MLAFVRTISLSLSLSLDFSYRARWKFLLNIQRDLLEVNTRGSIHYPPSTYADFHVQNPWDTIRVIHVTKGSMCDFVDDF